MASTYIKFAKMINNSDLVSKSKISHLKEIEWKKHSILVLQKVKIYLDIFAHFKKAEEKKKLLRSNIFSRKDLPFLTFLQSRLFLCRNEDASF